MLTVFYFTELQKEKDAFDAKKGELQQIEKDIESKKSELKSLDESKQDGSGDAKNQEHLEEQIRKFEG